MNEFLPAGIRLRENDFKNTKVYESQSVFFTRQMSFLYSFHLTQLVLIETCIKDKQFHLTDVNFKYLYNSFIMGLEKNLIE